MVNNNNYYIVSVYEKIMVKLEELTKSLLAHKLITSTTGSLSDRAERRMIRAAEKAYDILKKRKSTVTNIGEMKIGVRWSNDQAAWARNINLALEEFRQEHPKWGTVLDETIAKHREVRRAYVKFEGEIPEEFYIEAICDVMKGTTSQEAGKIYRSILVMEKRLKKKRGPNYVILPE
ncbi:hypothetical protein ES703_02881 [subsurface metagenome]